MSFPSNVERSYGDDDGSDDDPFGSAELILERRYPTENLVILNSTYSHNTERVLFVGTGIWGVSGAEMSDDAMAASLTNLGKVRAPAPAPLFLQDESTAAFPSLGVSGALWPFGRVGCGLTCVPLSSRL